MLNIITDYFKSIFNQTLLDKIFSLTWRVIISLAILIITVQLVKLFKKFLRKTFKRVKMDDGISGFLVSLTGVLLYIIVGFFVAQSLGVDAASIIALLGSAGVTIGLAIQGSLANIAGGVLILILKPFKIGDYIIENTHNNEGTVVEIGLIYTKMNTFDNKTVILPNGILANSSIVNVTHTPFRMIELIFDIAYSADYTLAKDIIEKVVREDDAVLTEKPILIAMDSLDSSSVKICSRFYVKNENFIPTRYRIREKVKFALDANKIEIPFTQVVVHEAK